MKCDKCGDQMVKGILRSNSPISWVPDRSDPLLKRSPAYTETADLNLSSLQSFAFRCVSCRRIEIAFYKPIVTVTEKCATCGFQISESDKYCINCGQEIQPTDKQQIFVCPNCRNPVVSDDITCPNCGIDLDKFENDILNTCVSCGYSDPSLEDMIECPKCGALLPI